MQVRSLNVTRTLNCVERTVPQTSTLCSCNGNFNTSFLLIQQKREKKFNCYLYCPSFLRSCQILTMMLREFHFPTISLHSMMKQVRPVQHTLTAPWCNTGWEEPCRRNRSWTIPPLNLSCLVWVMWEWIEWACSINKCTLSSPETTICKPRQVQGQRLQNPDSNGRGLPVRRSTGLPPFLPVKVYSAFHTMFHCSVSHQVP